ncbi:MAG TPA: cupredoxin family copper-binding protein [Alphaproteobacteria bacterium]|nr:cupredoxin family copper-binding protein [Alphaproteobacteria bacterium]
MSARRRTARLAATLALPLLAGSWIGWHSVAAAPTSSEVVIDEYKFGPATLTVPRGTTVTWTNKDDDPHTVVSDSDPKLFKSGALDTDDHFTFTFTEAGTFKYFCTIHPRMQGTVIVQ